MKPTGAEKQRQTKVKRARRCTYLLFAQGPGKQTEKEKGGGGGRQTEKVKKTE
jgi:hypothetical protein